MRLFRWLYRWLYPAKTVVSQEVVYKTPEPLVPKEYQHSERGLAILKEVNRRLDTLQRNRETENRIRAEVNHHAYTKFYASLPKVNHEWPEIGRYDPLTHSFGTVPPRDKIPRSKVQKTRAHKHSSNVKSTGSTTKKRARKKIKQAVAPKKRRASPKDAKR